jgi:hypothetical protein
METSPGGELRYYAGARDLQKKKGQIRNLE